MSYKIKNSVDIFNKIIIILKLKQSWTWFIKKKTIKNVTGFLQYADPSSFNVNIITF